MRKIKAVLRGIVFAASTAAAWVKAHPRLACLIAGFCLGAIVRSLV